MIFFFKAKLHNKKEDDLVASYVIIFIDKDINKDFDIEFIIDVLIYIIKKWQL